MARLVAVAGLALLWSALLVPAAVTAGPSRLSFALDDTRYVSVIVLTHLRGDIVPLK